MFSRLDLFGKPVVLNFDGKDKSRSPAGAWFTLIFIGVAAWIVYLLGQDLIDHNIPKTIMSEYFEENPSPMVLSPDTFNVAFGLQHPTTFAHYINDSIYQVKAMRDQLIRVVKEDGTVDMVWNSTPLVTEVCTKEHFGIYASKFENIELNQLYCIKPNQPELDKIQIQGVFESPVFESVQIYLLQCDNLTSNMSCAPRETLNELLGGGWFATYYTNLAIEPRNYSNPNVGFRDSFYTTMSNNYFKEITLWLGHVEVTTDSGWLTKEKKTERYIKMDRTNELTSFSPTPNELIKFVIRVQKITQHYERSYIKVQEVLAQANGFVSVGLVVGLIIFIRYSKIKFYEKLINELFDVKSLEQTKTTRKKPSKRSPRKNISRLYIDGDNAENQGNRTGGQEKILEANDFASNKSPKSPNKRKNSKNSSRTPQFGGEADLKKQKKSNSSSPQREKSRIELNYHILSSDKDSQTIKIEVPKDIKIEETKRIEDTDMAIPKLKSSFSNILKSKAKQSDRPLPKDLEDFEVQACGESFLAHEDGVMKSKSGPCDDLEMENNSRILKKESSSDVEGPKLDRQNDQHIDKEEIGNRAEELPSHLAQGSYQINISFWEYIRSFFWKSRALKEKFGLLEEGIRRIEERLNIFNLLKKMREIDKLKLLLLENEQFVLFNALPNPELSISTEALKEKSFANVQLKEAKFIWERGKQEIIKSSYIDLKKKKEPSTIDRKLLEIYDDIIDS